MEKKEFQVLPEHQGRVDLQERTETLVLPGPGARLDGMVSLERVAKWVNLVHRANKESLERQVQEDYQALKGKQDILEMSSMPNRHMSTHQWHILLTIMTIKFILEIYIQSTERVQEVFIQRKIS